MNHIKLNSCPSTQDYLRNFLEKFDGDQQVLVSSLKQTQEGEVDQIPGKP